MLTFDEVVGLVGSKQKPLLIAIDGLPLSGKTTLAIRLMNELGAECVQLDDFVKPEAEWRSRDMASFPFDWIRYDEFVSAVRSLAQNHGCLFHPYDWETGRTSDEPKVMHGDGITIVEGVSALHPDLAPLYDLRVWIDSNAKTTLAAAFEKGVGSWAHEWGLMFLPGVELYLRTHPKARADVVALGRGCIQLNPQRSVLQAKRLLAEKRSAARIKAVWSHETVGSPPIGGGSFPPPPCVHPAGRLPSRENFRAIT